MFNSLNGRSVVVTGGTKGIGKGIAAAFAANGCLVVIAGRDAAAGRQAETDLGPAATEGGGKVRYVQADVADPLSCARLVGTATEWGGGLDVVCCNAGIFPAAPLAEMTPAQLDEVLSVNLKSTFYTVQAAIPALRESSRGRVLVTSSITGPVTGYTGWAHYGASKAGQLGFVRTAALELARAQVTVNAILPGNIATEGLDDLGADYLQTMKASIPLGRLGTIGDVASAALFLASDEAAFITGQTLVIDGGQTIPESLEAMG